MNDRVIEKINNFSTEILKRYVINKKATHKNIVCSPISIMELLMMILSGADSDTYDELVNLMGLEAEDISDFSAICKRLISDARIMSISNAIITAEQVELKEDYINVIKQMYDGELIKANHDELTQKINEWVQLKTKGMIKSMPEQIFSPESFVLLNALCFIALWRKKYEESDLSDGVFYNWKHEEQKVVMLKSVESVYVSDENVSGFVKWYKDCEYVFMALLPEQGIKPWKLLADMEPGYLSKLFRKNQERAEVNVKLPEFSMSFEDSLKDTIEIMGVKEIFENDADLSKMVEMQGTSVEDIIHKARIEVNRNGTKASAVTMGVVYAGLPPRKVREVYLNRPFIYAIMDVRTAIPVFVGMVNEIGE